jgi:hypothetical protein
MQATRAASQLVPVSLAQSQGATAGSRIGQGTHSTQTLSTLCFRNNLHQVSHPGLFRQVLGCLTPWIRVMLALWTLEMMESWTTTILRNKRLNFLALAAGCTETFTLFYPVCVFSFNFSRKLSYL